MVVEWRGLSGEKGSSSLLVWGAGEGWREGWREGWLADFKLGLGDIVVSEMAALRAMLCLDATDLV